MRIETVPVSGDNYAYLVICTESGRAAAVDPADAGAVARRLEQIGARLAAIWCTHHHGDHTGGNRALLELVGGCPVYGHAQDAGRIPGITDAVEHGAVLELGKLEAQVLHTPGHTRGSACYRVGDALLTGDTLFAAGCGRLFEGDPATMFRSLHEVIRPLPPQTRIFCGHEYTEKNLDFAWGVEPESPALRRRIDAVHAQRRRGEPSVPFTLEEELATSPFLRCESPEIIETLERIHALADRSPLGVFTRLRELRNAY